MLVMKKKGLKTYLARKRWWPQLLVVQQPVIQILEQVHSVIQGVHVMVFGIWVDNVQGVFTVISK